MRTILLFLFSIAIGLSVQASERVIGIPEGLKVFDGAGIVYEESYEEEEGNEAPTLTIQEDNAVISFKTNGILYVVQFNPHKFIKETRVHRYEKPHEDHPHNGSKDITYFFCGQKEEHSYMINRSKTKKTTINFRPTKQFIEYLQRLGIKTSIVEKTIEITEPSSSDDLDLMWGILNLY